MDILNLSVSRIADSSKRSAKKANSKQRKKGNAAPFLEADIRFRNTSDSCMTLNLKDSQFRVTYNDKGVQYQKKLLLNEPHILNQFQQVKLCKGESIIIQVHSFFLVDSFLLHNKDRYEATYDYSYLVTKILPTLKFYYTEHDGGLELGHHEILKSTIRYRH